MSRRDFLFLRTEGRKRVVEISCEKLYMRFVDARSGAAREAGEQSTLGGDPWWSGEPPSQLDCLDLEGLFRELEDDLAEADVVQVMDREWLVEGEFRERLERILSAFHKVGGRVRYPALKSPVES